MTRHTRATTVVSHPARFSTALVSDRLSRIQDSWTASSASPVDPSIPKATARSCGRCLSNRSVSQSSSLIGHVPPRRSVIPLRLRRAGVTPTEAKEGTVTTGMRTVIHPVKDLAHSKALFGELLGVTSSMDEPYYVGFMVGDQEVSLDPNGHAKGMTGPLGYWHVDDIESTFERLLAGGSEPDQAISDVGGGKLTASVKDGDGNVIGLIQST